MIIGSEKGFTLIEIIIVIAIIGIITIPIYNMNIAAFKFWNYNQDKLDLEQQVRVISLHLEDIKGAIDVKVEDIDGNEGNELLINLGDIDGDNNDNYIQYIVNQGKFSIKKPKTDFDGTSYPAWPGVDDWGNSRSITTEIIDSFEFAYDDVKKLVTINLDLVLDNQRYLISNKIHPRILKD